MTSEINNKYITKEKAIEKAKQTGEKAYVNIDMFEIIVKEDPIYWMVDFSRPQAIEDGETQHFSVWVEKKSGQARLFKGR
jgi:hypothetical protein